MDADFEVLSSTLGKILSPTYLEEVARKTGFIQRKGKLKATDFIALCGFLNDRSGLKTLTQLCSVLDSERNVNLSAEGLNQRFNEAAGTFVKTVFTEALSQRLTDPSGFFTKYSAFFNRIRVLDSSGFGLPPPCADRYKGSTGAGLKVQLEYDLLSGDFLHLEVQDGIIADKTFGSSLADSLRPKDLILRDLGYFTYMNLLEIELHDAFYISRLKLDTTIYQKADGESKFIQLNLEDMIEQLACGEAQELNEVYIGKEYKMRTRLIICKLTEKQMQKRLILQKKKESRGGVTHSPRHKKLSALNLYATNIPDSVASKQEIHELYTLRWQIELVFKTWKSVYKIHRIKKMKPERVDCHLYGTLLALLISSTIMFQIRSLLYRKKKKETSEYKGMEIIKEYLGKLQRAIFDDPSTLPKVLESIYRTIEKNGKKSHRYQKRTVFEILGLAIEKQVRKPA